MSVRILVVDDRTLVRAGFAALLSSRSDLAVVGEAANGQEALELAKALNPDLALVDVAMPGPSGVELARCLQEEVPDVKVLMLTMHEDAATLRAAMHAGALGYLVKNATRAELFNAVDTVIRGELYIHPVMLHTLLAPTSGSARAMQRSLGALTSRQVEVLRGIARGYTNAQIAERLFLSVRTIEYHRRNMMEALGFTSRVEMVQFAVDQGLLDDR